MAVDYYSYKRGQWGKYYGEPEPCNLKLMPVGNSQEWYPSKLVNGDVDSRVCKQREIKNHHELRENIVESLGVIQKINILLKRLPSLVEKQNKPKQKTNKQTKTIAVIFGYKKKSWRN